MKLEQLVEVCRRFNDAGVRYVLVGGFAMILHGFERLTGDIDFLVDTSEENVAKIRNALGDLLPAACSELDAKDVKELIVVRMIGEDLIIDLMKKVGDVDYEAVAKKCFVEETDGVKIPVASLDCMIQLKQGIRERDWKDLLFLQGKKEYLSRGSAVERTSQSSWWRRLFCRR